MPPPPPDASPSGIYQGRLVSTTAGNLDVMGVISENSDTWLRSLFASYSGIVSVDGEALTGTLTEYRGERNLFYGFDGVSSVLLDGTVAEREGISGDYTGDLDQGQFFLNYLDLYERGPSLILLSGIWTSSLGSAGGGVYVVTMEIGADGQLFGSDSDGCVFRGELSVIDGRYNAYQAAISISLCNEIDGDYSGLAYLSDFAGGQDNQLDFGISNESFAFAARLDRL